MGVIGTNLANELGHHLVDSIKLSRDDVSHVSPDQWRRTMTTRLFNFTCSSMCRAPGRVGPSVSVNEKNARSTLAVLSGYEATLWLCQQFAIENGH